MERTLNMIEDLEALPCLWDETIPDNKNRSKKRKALEELALKYAMTNENMEKKVSSLKFQFRREHKKLTESMKNGSYKKSTWFGYQPLLFLLKGKPGGGQESDCVEGEQINETLKRPYLDEEDKEPEEVRFLEIEEYLLRREGSKRPPAEFLPKREELRRPREESPERPKESRRLIPKPRSIVDQAFIARETVNCMKSLTDVVKRRDEYAVYGDHVANKLRNSGRTRIEISLAQREINEILLKLEMGMYDLRIERRRP